MGRTLAISSLMLGGIWLALSAPAAGQALIDGVPSESYTPLHAWYDVNQSLGVWEDRGGDQYTDEYLVDVRDTGVGSTPDRGESYGTNVETWAQFDDPPNAGSAWPARVGGFTGTQNGKTTWEVRNAAGWDDAGGWTDDDSVGEDGIGFGNGYTIFMVMNIHNTQRYNGTWNVDPGAAQDDVPILNGSTTWFNEEPTTGSEPEKGLIWIDAGRDGTSGPQWVMDSGNELVTGAVTLNEWQVHTFVIADTGNSSLTSHYVNGVLLGQGDAGTDAMGNLQLWSTDGGWHRAADLDFAEGIFYDEVVTTTDRADIESYLSDKWLASVVTADLDSDGDVDGTDFLLGQRGSDFATFLPAWQGSYGGAPVGALATIPEPSTLGLVFLGAISLLRIRLRVS